MKDTKIRWAGSSWNVGIGCERISPGCGDANDPNSSRCYAEALVEKRAGMKGWPESFESGIWKPQKLGDPAKWLRTGNPGPVRIFVNSLSDAHWKRWTNEQITSLYDTMLEVPGHDYLVLTKRPQRMADFMLGTPDQVGWLDRHGLDAVPPWIWLGTTIENDRYTFRADHLRRIPASVRFLSCEPLLGPLPSLDLTGIHWVIEGGESGNGRKQFREMDWDWARDLRDHCRSEGIAFFHKQGSAWTTEKFQEIDGERIEEYPIPHPATTGGERPEVGIYLDDSNAQPVALKGPQGNLL